MPDAVRQEWHPRHSPWLVAVGVMLATFMQVLDTSIANIALPHIAGSLSSTPDQATWVLTSYLVANAIILPMTGWLSNYFGRKRLLISCIGMFTFASVLCGMSPSLPMLILARIVQGAGGGAMVPIAQAVMLESFPPHKRGIAMATFAQAVVVAPIIGPTLGGWITDNYSWRWIFYINLPVGLLAIFLAEWLVEDPPYIKRNVKAAIDVLGFALLAVWLATLQIVLDKGQEADWLGAAWVRWFLAVSAAAMIAFIIREFNVEHPLVNLRIFRSRNFAVGVVLMTVVGLILYGTTAELPLFLQTLMGYPALQSGYALSPRGAAAFVTTFFVGRLVGRVPTRWMLLLGFSLLSFSAFLLGRINLQVSFASIVLPTVLNGVAISFIFVPLTTVTMSQLRQRDIGSGTGLYNLMLNLGGSVGIALVTTLVARRTQVHQALLAGHLTPSNPLFTRRFGAARTMLERHGDPVAAIHRAWAIFYNVLNRQSHLWGFVDTFRYFGLLVLCCVPLIFLLKPPPHAPVRRVDVH
ncbi:MAG: DHA2 family efflux MFS transporter permease subunit [Verrucomicrobia bacterium]|nr:DHA2 family efflux MFS transporter permease subunit [Verrucomicrobiota bacterium]MDE3097995.1 DHA2 family efflux MFS transporter permease subunit [Verrucomicrobiota bacterium]